MMLVHSANDMAVVLAGRRSGSIEVLRRDEHNGVRLADGFVNPNGLPADEQICLRPRPSWHAP
jgi:D-alanyl-D-alanine carboxypeptidase